MHQAFIRTMNRIACWIFIPFMVFCGCETPSGTLPQSNSKDADTVAAMQAVQRTFDGLAAHDSVAIATVVLPDANFQRWAADSIGIWRTVNMSGNTFISRLGQPGPAYLERTWETSVRIDGDVAVFTAPYDFWVEQSCSHCGIDVITLIRSAALDSEFRGWRIASLTYTVDARGESDCRARFAGMPASPFPTAEE
jgi:hypothetical protein